VHGHALLGISRGTSASQREKSEAADLMEMVPNDAESGLAAAPCAIQGALAIAKPEKVAKTVFSWYTGLGSSSLERFS